MNLSILIYSVEKKIKDDNDNWHMSFSFASNIDILTETEAGINTVLWKIHPETCIGH
jgi:hypothetical protein